jgi:cysteine desulfurase
MIYLDHNASAPLHASARARLQDWLGAAVHANSFAAHAPGRAATRAVEGAREAIAALVPWARPNDVVFTSGATEANALALASTQTVCAPCEHPSVLAWCDVRLQLASTGQLDLRTLDAARVPAGCARVSVQLANGETGVLQPLPEVASWAHARGLDVHVDASQAPGRVDVSALEHADLVTFSAHKIGGPQGVGALVVRGGAERATARQRGGPHERGARAGTHPVALIDAFGAAARAVAGRHAGMPVVARLRDDLEAGLRARGGVVIGAEPRLPNTCMAAWSGLEPADLVMALDLEGVCVSAGAACASGSHRASEGLRAMGFPSGGVRWSLGPETLPEDIAGALAALDRVLARVA